MPGQDVNIDALIGEGYRLHQAGDLREAEKLYKQVLTIDPENAEVLQLWGHIAEATKNYAAAAELMRRSLAIDSSQAQVWLAYALLLIEIRQDKDAIKALKSAIQLRPDYAEAHFNMGLVMIATGRPKEAPQHWRKAISLKPDYVEAYRVLTSVEIIEPGSTEFDEIEKLIADKDLATEDRFVLHYALANIYKKSDDQAAFSKHLFEANRVQSECAPAIPEGASPHERIKAAFTVENIKRAALAPASDLTPIFIVGMPRSGTTLVERILASHPLVEAGAI
ncbi:MAG: tetratricopeptide repeat protein [Sphingomonadales bacterium]